MKANKSNYILSEEQYNKILSRIDTSGDCWLWTGAKSSAGYGNISFTENRKRRWLLPHRAVYVYLNGEHEGELDHLCRNRLCCNPEHLQVVDSRTNTLRGTGPTAKNYWASHCKRGHEFDWVSPTTGRRRCTTCDRERRRRKHDKEK